MLISQRSLSPTRSARSGLGSARFGPLQSTASGDLSKAAASTAITVEMLSAMVSTDCIGCFEPTACHQVVGTRAHTSQDRRHMMQRVAMLVPVHAWLVLCLATIDDMGAMRRVICSQSVVRGCYSVQRCIQG